MKLPRTFAGLLLLVALFSTQIPTVSLAQSKDEKKVKTVSYRGVNGTHYTLQMKDEPKEIAFIVRIENISDKDGQVAADGMKWPFALSPGLWVAHDKDVALFKDGKAASPGLEMQAEDGNPEGLVKMLEAQHHAGHGVFNTPVGTNGPAPILPGGAYQFTVTAKLGMKLTVVTMFGQSNDWFYATEKGIELFDKRGNPVSGDVTSKFALYDAGTEKNEEPGVGPNQAPRQKAPNTGDDEHSVVHKAKASSFFTRTGQLFRVTITPEEKM